MENILVTGAISYMNSKPHIGHMYENILGDFIKNQLQILGKKSKFLTGADEHGMKIMKCALENDMKPIDFCNKNVQYFVDMNNKYQIDYDHYVRTTNQEHKNNVKKCINEMIKNNDIYIDNYSGYYSVREECYVSDDIAKQSNYVDPVTNKPYDLISEESYFFKLDKYKKEICDVISSIIPNKYQKEIMDRTKNLSDIQDLSITRTSFDWGIPFPENEKHIVYVWIDALLSYYSGSLQLYGSRIRPNKVLHLIGKDIVWFHSVYMPAILESGKIDIETTNILVHGFVCDKNGAKMSKSIGNVISPEELDKYPVEAVRFYLLTEVNLGEDISFSIDNMIEKYDLNLIDNFGNLTQRLCNLCVGHNESINKCDEEEHIEIEEIEKVENVIKNYDLVGYFSYVQTKIAELNSYLTDKKPWSKDLGEEERILALKISLTKFNYITKLMYPYIPNKIKDIRNIFGFKKDICLCDSDIGDIDIRYDKTQKIFSYIIPKSERRIAKENKKK